MSLQPLFKKLFHLLDGDLLPKHSKKPATKRFAIFLHKYRTVYIDCYARHGKLDIVKCLYSFGEKCSEKVMNQIAENGHLETFKYLHILGMDYNPNEIIIRAASRNHMKIIEYLHSIGKSSNVSNRAMDLAARSGHLEMLKYLRSIGLNAGALGMNLAARYGYLEIVKYLYSIGVQVGARAMHWAEMNGHVEVVKYFQSIQ